MEKVNIIAINNPDSIAAQCYRMLRSRILYTSLVNKIKTILITSSGVSEGKSEIGANLAACIAQQGFKTLIWDCNNEDPSIHKYFDIVESFPTFTKIMEGKFWIEETIHKTNIDNLFTITLRNSNGNGTDFLGYKNIESAIERIKEKFEYIIMDASSVNICNDSLVMAQYSDACVLVVSYSKSSKGAVIRSKELLESVNAKILGVVLNRVRNFEEEYYYPKLKSQPKSKLTKRSRAAVKENPESTV